MRRSRVSTIREDGSDFQIPPPSKLGIGRHRALFVVGGDLSTTEALIDVVPPGTTYFATDVDGTLTTVETEEFTALLTGTLPSANPDSPAALQLLADKRYRPLYLTARPEFLVGRTRELVASAGFPPGIVRTLTSIVPIASPGQYKQNELDALGQQGIVVSYAIGNTASDADAYFLSNIAPDDHRIFFQFTDAAHSGRRIEAFAELLGELAGLAELPCN